MCIMRKAVDRITHVLKRNKGRFEPRQGHLVYHDDLLD